MPTFVIHSLNRQAQLSTIRQAQIHVGRDADRNQLVLPGTAVSREHAVFKQTSPGKWQVYCVSATNPIVVDGALTKASALVAEGSEVLVGTEHLLVFTQNEVTAKVYLGAKSHFARSECLRCHWKGMVSALNRQPVCPQCGGTNLRAENVYRKAEASAEAPEGATKAVDPAEVKAQLKKLKSAKKSRIERVDGKAGGPSRKELSEDESLLIGKAAGAAFALGGFVMGDGLTVSWDGHRWGVQSALTFPAMKVNGNKCKSAFLNGGDIIEVGSNRFRFVSD